MKKCAIVIIAVLLGAVSPASAQTYDGLIGATPAPPAAKNGYAGVIAPVDPKAGDNTYAFLNQPPPTPQDTSMAKVRQRQQEQKAFRQRNLDLLARDRENAQRKAQGLDPLPDDPAVAGSGNAPVKFKPLSVPATVSGQGYSFQVQ